MADSSEPDPAVPGSDHQLSAISYQLSARQYWLFPERVNFGVTLGTVKGKRRDPRGASNVSESESTTEKPPFRSPGRGWTSAAAALASLGLLMVASQTYA